ncbi:hypothetical protein IQ238_16575 [Pleurocapsales cyanobacterium LEGE 06147]|nr:hypothetical protein [Pleurocapsales cyanobacterium LEGE 06147]
MGQNSSQGAVAGIHELLIRRRMKALAEREVQHSNAPSPSSRLCVRLNYIFQRDSDKK